jgi:hypothetical protein
MRDEFDSPYESMKAERHKVNNLFVNTDMSRKIWPWHLEYSDY